MGRGDRASMTAKTSQNQFLTPDKPSANRPKPASTSKKRSGTPASSSSTLRNSKRSSLPSTSFQDQPTLTQIDFVSTSFQNTKSDDDLDYIENGPHGDTERAREIIEIGDSDENDDEWQPPGHPPKKQARRVQFQPSSSSKSNGSKQKSTSQSKNDGKRSRRKSGDGPKNRKKDMKEDNKNTLTQMDFVRHYVKVEPDDDVQLDYTYIPTKKEGGRKSQTPKKEKDELAHVNPDSLKRPSSDQKRRKLNHDLEAGGEKKSIETNNGRHTPVTPQKQRMREIPSSQSPESPGLAVITSSQFRGATGSPLKRPSLKVSPPIKEEQPGYEQALPPHGDLSKKSPSSHGVSTPLIPNSPLSHRDDEPEKATEDELETQSKSSTPRPQAINKGAEIHREMPDEPHNPPASTARTVVYETDGESDYDDSQYDLPRAPTLPKRPDAIDPNDHEDEDDELPNDSPDLPSMPQDRPGSELGLLQQSESNLPSDASICYRRMQPATQFPLEPIPTLNTQKMAELFPEETNVQSTMATMSQPSSPLRSKDTHDSSLRTLTEASIQLPKQTQKTTQTQTQSQSQTQDVDKTATEIVPESSPVAQHENYDTGPDESLPRTSRDQEAVVQVESSQPADRFHQRLHREHGSAPRGIVSGSQILTSSVMESVPMPAFWLGSQDSVGEPYSG